MRVTLPQGRRRGRAAIWHASAIFVVTSSSRGCLVRTPVSIDGSGRLAGLVVPGPARLRCPAPSSRARPVLRRRVGGAPRAEVRRSVRCVPLPDSTVRAPPGSAGGEAAQLGRPAADAPFGPERPTSTRTQSTPSREWFVPSSAQSRQSGAKPVRHGADLQLLEALGEHYVGRPVPHTSNEIDTAGALGRFRRQACRGEPLDPTMAAGVGRLVQPPAAPHPDRLPSLRSSAKSSTIVARRLQSCWPESRNELSGKPGDALAALSGRTADSVQTGLRPMARW